MAAPQPDMELQQNQRHPLLSNRTDGNNNLSPMQKAIGQTYKSTGHLAKLLPSGTVLAFQLLAPTLAKQGHCGDMNRMMAGGLVILCTLSCFVLSFTDSFRDEKGKVRYGFATFKGLWVIDGGATLDPHAAVEYKIKFLDFVHATVSAMIFVAIALFDQNVVSCFYPISSEDTKQVLTSHNITSCYWSYWKHAICQLPNHPPWHWLSGIYTIVWVFKVLVRPSSCR